MLYFFYGTNHDKARAKPNALIENLRKKKPEAKVFRLDANYTLADADIDKHLGSQALRVS